MHADEVVAVRTQAVVNFVAGSICMHEVHERSSMLC